MFALRVRAERRSRSRGVANPAGGGLRRVARSFRVLGAPWRRAGELGAVARSSERETILAGRVLSRMTVTLPPRRAERPGVMSVTRSGRVVGDLTGGRGGGPRGPSAGAAGRSRGPANRSDKWVWSAAFGVGSGGFSRSCESPSKARGCAADPPDWVHSVFRTLRGVIFVNFCWAKRHFTLPYGW